MPRVFLPAAISGVLLWAAFFPLDLGILGFVALVPWLSLVRAEVSRRRRYAAAYLGGFIFSALATQWVRVAHPMMYLSWLAFSLVLPLFWVLALDFIRRLDRLGVPLALAVPVVWVGARIHADALPDRLPILEAARPVPDDRLRLVLPRLHAAREPLVHPDRRSRRRLCGVVRGWRGERDGCGLGLPKSSQPPAPPPRWEGGGRIAATIATIALAPRRARLRLPALQHSDFASGPRVVALQGSIPQAEKMQKGQSLGDTYAKLHLDATESKPRPDLIVWPETCYPVDWVEVPPGESPSAEFSKYAARSVEEFATVRFGAPTLLGLNGIVWEGDRPWKYNSALLVDAKGNKLGRYDKMHLVPFGEYVPFGETLPFMQWFTPYEKEYSCRPGEHWTRFPLPTASGDHYTLRLSHLLRGLGPLSRAAVRCQRTGELPRQHLERRLVRWHRGARGAPRDLPVPRDRGAAVDRPGREHGHLRRHRPRRPRDRLAGRNLVEVQEDGRHRRGECAD